MKMKHHITWILTGFVTSLLITRFSAMAADNVVVIPLYSSSNNISTVTSKTGRVWMDRNLGAIRVAGSKTDSLAYGWLYQWGRPADGHESRTSPVTDLNDFSSGDVPGHGDFIRVDSAPHDWRNPQNDSLWQGKNGTNNPCPPGFRLPTAQEWQAEAATWSSKDIDGAYNSKLKLPTAGCRYRVTGGMSQVGYSGRYWSSDVSATQAQVFYFDPNPNSAIMSPEERALGGSVRCIKD